MAEPKSVVRRPGDVSRPGKQMALNPTAAPRPCPQSRALAAVTARAVAAGGPPFGFLRRAKNCPQEEPCPPCGRSRRLFQPSVRAKSFPFSAAKDEKLRRGRSHPAGRLQKLARFAGSAVAGRDFPGAVFRVAKRLSAARRKNPEKTTRKVLTGEAI
jgi:hypothetical protein